MNIFPYICPIPNYWRKEKSNHVASVLRGNRGGLWTFVYIMSAEMFFSLYFKRKGNRLFVYTRYKVYTVHVFVYFNIWKRWPSENGKRESKKQKLNCGDTVLFWATERCVTPYGSPGLQTKINRLHDFIKYAGGWRLNICFSHLQTLKKKKSSQLSALCVIFHIKMCLISKD